MPSVVSQLAPLPDSLRILIVDDNADAAATLNVLLTSFGFETSMAALE